MLMKRKRSSSSLSSSTTTSPTHQHTITIPISAIPSHLPSRTMKRFRNDRPSDQEVHRKFYEWRAHHYETPSSCIPPEHTLNLLYSGKQTGPQPVVEERLQQSTTAQSSLHQFWNINSAPSSTSSLNVTQPSTASNCEDCGTGLHGGDAMEMNGCSDETACGACGKHVCFSCSVSNLGEQKRCLQCAGRKVWVGGLGWTNVGPGVPVC